MLQPSIIQHLEVCGADGVMPDPDMMLKVSADSPPVSAFSSPASKRLKRTMDVVLFPENI